MKILTNHIGYDINSPKHAVVIADEKVNSLSCRIINYDKKDIAFEITANKVGKVDKWRDWFFWTVDFENVKEEGNYIIECSVGDKTVTSSPFLIQKDLLIRNTLSNLMFYFKSQRCSGLLDKADRNMFFEGKESGPVDVHGGWYDATGDYSKILSHLSFSLFFNPQQIPLTVWSLFKSYELLEKNSNLKLNEFKRRLLDEAMYGADYLVRIKNPKGSFYRVVHSGGMGKKHENRRIAPVMTGFDTVKDGDLDNVQKSYFTMTMDNDSIYEVGYRAGAGLSVAALAMAGTYDVCGEIDNKTYLDTACRAFDYLEENNTKLAYNGIENIIDDYCALPAAVELYKATGDDKYRIKANEKAEKLLKKFIKSDKYENYWSADGVDRPFFHASDAGFPVISLLNYLEIADDRMKGKVLETVKKSFIFDFKITEEVSNPFGYCRQLVQNKKGEKRSSFFYPHDSETAPWWQGENARLGSIAVSARLALKFFKDDKIFSMKLKKFSQNQLNWILGLNPFDKCMLHGSGRNNPEYIFFDSYEYSNCPGGICNGITAGHLNENDIDFNENLQIGGDDNNWRWTEQWLPHSSWFIYAVMFID